MNKELSPLKAFQLFCKELKIENSEFANVIEITLKEQQERIEELEETNNLMFIREHKSTKKLKAFEIIKEKRVDVLSILCGACETCEEYNEHHISKEDIQNGIKSLTQEEFNLLKECFNNEY